MNDFRSKIMAGSHAEVSPVLGRKEPKGANADAGLHSVAVPRYEVRTSDTRDADRHRLEGETVALTHNGKRYEAKLINVSGGGAMVDASFAPLLWDRVDLHLGENGTLESVVRWIKGDRLGLEFAHETRLECSPKERAELLRDVLARNFPDLVVEVPAEEPTPPAPEPAVAEDEHKRGESRHPLIWSGLIHFDHDSSPVRLRNISEQGALIETSLTLPEGAELLLDLGEAGSLFAKVSWTKGDQAGLAFQQRFDLAELAKARPQVAPQQWMRPAYLDEESAQSSTAARAWDHVSLGELRSELEGFLKH